MSERDHQNLLVRVGGSGGGQKMDAPSFDTAAEDSTVTAYVLQSTHSDSSQHLLSLCLSLSLTHTHTYGALGQKNCN